MLNDAIVIDIARNEEKHYFGEFFADNLKKRYGEELSKSKFKSIGYSNMASFMGRAVIGNVRAFVFGCNFLAEETEGADSVGLPDIEKTLKYLASEYYWPLLEELEPKLGCYEPLVEPARELGELLYEIVSQSVIKANYSPSFLIHRDHVERLKKVFEMLEYTGFIAKRDASRALKSGGRGSRYILNLCNLMEVITPNRLTREMFQKWTSVEKEAAEIYKGGRLDEIIMPELSPNKDLGILVKNVSILQKSAAYPYGLTVNKVETLINAGIETVGQLAEATDEELLLLDGIGEGWLKRLRNIVAQAIWM